MKGTISQTGTTILGNSGEGTVSTKVIQFKANTFVGAGVTIRGRVRRAALTTDWEALPYKKRYLNGAVADDTVVSTAINGDSIIEVNAAGLDIQLDATVTSGTLDWEAVDLEG